MTRAGFRWMILIGIVALETRYRMATVANFQNPIEIGACSGVEYDADFASKREDDVELVRAAAKWMERLVHKLALHFGF
jgi:hypothetical protein